jgi:hypothetical protein
VSLQIGCNPSGPAVFDWQATRRTTHVRVKGWFPTRYAVGQWQATIEPHLEALNYAESWVLER